MKYCLIINNTVQEIIPEFVEIFPNIPIQDRYSKEFLSNCVAVDKSKEVEVGWNYKDGVFSKPEPIIVEEHIKEVTTN